MVRTNSPGRQIGDDLASPLALAPPKTRRRPAAKAQPWRARYAARLLFTDALVLATVISVGVQLRFGHDRDAFVAGGVALSYLQFGLLLGTGWMACLQGFGARDPRIVVGSPDEYKRVFTSSVIFFGLLSIALVLLKIDISRGFLAFVFPTGVLLLFLSRRLWRSWTYRSRRLGFNLTPVLLTGSIEETAHVAANLLRDPKTGLRVCGVMIDEPLESAAETADSESQIPMYGNQHTLDEVLDISGAQAVIVTNPSRVGHQAIRDMIWTLPERGVEVVVAPHLIDVAPNRLHMTHISSMPFIQVEEPGHSAAGSWPKVIFDRVGAAALIILLSPVLLAAAVAVKLSSPGPVFYRQERIGRDGVPFRMTKFRSMRVGADDELVALLLAAGDEAGPLAKLKTDPRITRVGSLMRRYSIDELPQLFNVLQGTMSLVGPRPQRDFEVAQYDDAARRRLLVRPGLTGLWQVSGRSDLSWDDAIRLDIYYVENWSLFSDLVILWRTVRAVLFSDGAY